MYEATECYRQNSDLNGIKSVTAGCKISGAACVTASVGSLKTTCASCTTDLCNSGAATSPAVALVLAVFAAIYKLM